ncbi:sialate O-acetylesterase [Hyunsoonleella jejuensis]|uniref:Sialate O-acetylesterase n=1 Tax=Hyunsoonleella jejuensis TaxID=419940 RepID=A0A1H8ZY59_9FLAO|nr:sialate O-acetylesterase [Hyunsoonleella jejuensis]SEP69324.1 sialate O-acetylesterase [Hyunsoonleella jejuensis]
MYRKIISLSPLRMATVLFCLFSILVHAEVKLPAIVSSNMVLQRNTTVKLWGWADANETITISTSWLTDNLNVIADDNGDWYINVNTTNSKAAQSIKITSKTSNIELSNILFGEVWICSGQSNMQQPMEGYMGQPTFEGPMTATKAKNRNLRLFTVERVASKTPLNDISDYKSWQEATPESVIKFSAVAYFFGQQLQDILDVPVGLIHTSWGGSTIEAWISEDILSKYETVAIANSDISKRPQHIPTALFNAMIHPITNYSIAGALWYQGESNRKEAKYYETLFPAMVQDWRDRWNIGSFPFYFVQIAPFIYSGNDKYQASENSAFMRESQLNCVDLIPNSGIAITLDIGSKYYIHPPKKKEVADRLLLHALHQTYGYKSIDHISPLFNEKEEKDGGILLSFKHADLGLFAFDTLKDFEIAGEDKVFHPAEAKIVDRNKVLVTSSKVLHPKEVRYCWKNWVTGTLYSTNLLPVSSFRTDSWDNATRAE